MGKIAAIIPAAGQGKRMGSGTNKQLLILDDKPILAHTLKIFQECTLIDEIVVAAAKDEVSFIKENIIKRFGFDKVRKVVVGGKERQDSVRAGLEGLSEQTEWVVVHDGARPLLLLSQLEELIQRAFAKTAVIAAVPVKDTIKQVDATGQVIETLNRETLRAVQTPQIFRRDILAKAHEEAFVGNFSGTDDASLLERINLPVHTEMGSYENIKITTPEDLDIALTILKKRRDNHLRVGFGYDVHCLVEGRNLILGGVKIAHELGLEGHSDADVLVHAIMDALLGAAGLGDIGKHFPDTDERYKGISSMALLAHVAKLLTDCGLQVGNIDATIVAQRPKLAPYINDMNLNVSGILGVSESQVNIKATTTERLGFAGREEGIAAYSVTCLFPR